MLGDIGTRTLKRGSLGPRFSTLPRAARSPTVARNTPAASTTSTPKVSPPPPPPTAQGRARVFTTFRPFGAPRAATPAHNCGLEHPDHPHAAPRPHRQAHGPHRTARTAYAIRCAAQSTTVERYRFKCSYRLLSEGAIVILSRYRFDIVPGLKLHQSNDNYYSVDNLIMTLSAYDVRYWSMWRYDRRRGTAASACSAEKAVETLSRPAKASRVAPSNPAIEVLDSSREAKSDAMRGSRNSRLCAMSFEGS